MSGSDMSSSDMSGSDMSVFTHSFYVKPIMWVIIYAQKKTLSAETERVFWVLNACALSDSLSLTKQ